MVQGKETALLLSTAAVSFVNILFSAGELAQLIGT